MVNIVLVCVEDLSTGRLAVKMREVAKEKNIEATINSYSYLEVEKHLDDADVVLVGPQIKFKLDKIKDKCDKLKIPVEVMNTFDFGMIKSENLLNRALKIIEENRINSLH
jgi:Phosphotransferase system cellobiose-specific component IIB